ncbi:type I-E CRISPR-associated protein Cse2/CasB [Microbacterium sp.]|uniref:type I-E CRISPR-associated protein Cse2/CasB n=1 Tax=Microbacterium sp. TaxID=51671 RepID=UPI0039E561A6
MQRFVEERVSALQRLYRANSSAGVAALARLRRGVGKQPTDDLELFGLAVPEDDTTTARLHDPQWLLPDDETTEEERAAFAAITLYAVHQQSRRETSLHREGYSFGRSARLLGKHSNASNAVRARFAAVGTATTWDETLYHARGLIQQFRQHSIPLDYGRFARDLFDLQHPSRADRVRLRWGRDFYRVRRVDDDGDDANQPNDGNARIPASDYED